MRAISLTNHGIKNSKTVATPPTIEYPEISSENNVPLSRYWIIEK